MLKKTKGNTVNPVLWDLPRQQWNTGFINMNCKVKGNQN